MLGRIIRSAYLNLFSGIILLLTAGYETWETIGEATIGAHHGILVFSIIQIAKSVPEILHGLTEIEEGKEFLEKNKPSRSKPLDTL